VFELNQDRVWGTSRGKTLLLAVIEPFKTNGEDATTTVVHYTKCVAPIVTDVRNIKSTVGWVETRKRWGLVDRDVQLAKAVFNPQADSESDYDEDD